ncbi:hypothetical protein PENTCL1PPCAC_23351, partial [Pristionchus entomophagus]
ISSGHSLNKFLKHYEPLNYQIVNTNRVSRSPDQSILLSFRAYDRDFKMNLFRIPEKDESTSSDFTSQTTKGKSKVSIHRLLLQKIFIRL